VFASGRFGNYLYQGELAQQVGLEAGRVRQPNNGCKSLVATNPGLLSALLPLCWRCLNRIHTRRNARWLRSRFGQAACGWQRVLFRTRSDAGGGGLSTHPSPVFHRMLGPEPEEVIGTDSVKARFEALVPFLGERDRRLVAVSEARAAG
jgi:hypothetical protein